MAWITMQEWKTEHYGIKYGSITLNEPGQYVISHDCDTNKCKIIQFIPRGSNAKKD